MRKNFQKGLCLGIAALASLNMSSAKVNAATPTWESTGVYSSSVNIGQGTLSWTPTFTVASNLKFNGDAQQLITGITNANDLPAGTSLYVRIADSVGTAPTSAQDWVKYTDNEIFSNSKLKRTNVGTYYIYWYVDGGTSGYSDISVEQQPS